MNTRAVIPQLQAITDRIVRRSRDTRAEYLARCARMRDDGPQRSQLSCSNFAHGFAACSDRDKQVLRLQEAANLGIVTAFNDMLSAHQPLESYPEVIKQAARELGCTAQVAGGVPAMCDGVTQGAAGMELSLFSRDTIAAATAIALSHNMFDAALCLGVCDKIVPGLLIGALSFGHLPVFFVPAGPMPSGLPNAEKAKIRQQYAAGEVDEEALLQAEAEAYHSPGTCTFYGTANSNQLLLEVMGLHVPGGAFANPGTPLRDALTRAAAARACRITHLGREYTPISEVVDERCIVNALVGLLATGGSTNHTIHWIAIARAAGIIIDWQDYADVSAVVPLLTRIYPNGEADVNHFHDAGGTALVISELLAAGMLHADVLTNWGRGLEHYARRVHCDQRGELVWDAPPQPEASHPVVRPVAAPFSAEGGLRLLTGNIGRAIIKVSAVAAAQRRVSAPARIFEDQYALKQSFERGELDTDFVAVIRGQGPAANGMPELHKLTPYLGILQDRGFSVALVTDGRMSGASGKVPAAIHLTPEALAGGGIAKIRDGDRITLDAVAGTLQAEVAETEWAQRAPLLPDSAASQSGVGRELFAMMRRNCSSAEQGATIFFDATRNA